MENNNEFDAVQMMRDIREKLSERYWNNPDVLKKEMQEIREKYNFNVTTLSTSQDRLPE